MEYLTFFKICDNYYYLLPNGAIDIDEGGKESTSYTSRIFQEALFSKLSNNQAILATELNQILRRNVKLKSDNYLFVRDDVEGYFLFVGLSKNALQTPFYSRTDPKIKIANEAKGYGKLAVCNFRLMKRKELLSGLLSDGAKLEDCIQAFADYAFFDRYVLWIYNRHTQVFTSLVSSHELPKEYVTRDDDNSLHAFLYGGKPSDYRPPNKGCVNEKFAENMQWLNRIRLRLGDHPEDIGIMDYLSVYPRFRLRPDTESIIKNCLETKYHEYLRKSQVALHKIQQQFSTYEPGKIDELLQSLTRRICDELCFQACSIFKKRGREEKLEIVAVKDKEQDGKPAENAQEKAVYDLTKESFTGSVYHSKEGWNFSYEITKDERNKHIYDEKTEGEGKTWLAFVLRWRTSKEGEKWGVIRVKNKYQRNNKKRLINFTTDDIESLQVIRDHLSNIFDVESQHLEYKKTIPELQTRLQNLRNFYKVFLHEIRSPMSPFNTSALRLATLLKKLPIETSARLPLERKVNDIYIIGERLSFIATTYYFHELIKPRELGYLFVMKDIVMPVLNVSVDYIRTQFGIEILREQDTLVEREVYGDKTLLSLAFNVLISNAAKYTPDRRFPIKISGQLDKDGQYFSLDVSNYGLRIYEDERERIFREGIRGREAIRYKSQGTGIGLHLSRLIMHNLHGKLILKSCFNPVIFTMIIPTFKWEDVKGGQDV